MSTSDYKLSQNCLNEIKLQINQRLFEAGLISSDVFRLVNTPLPDGHLNRPSQTP